MGGSWRSCRSLPRGPSDLGFQHLQRQLVEGDAAAVQLQQVVHGERSRLPQEWEAQEEAPGAPLLPVGALVLLQGPVEPVPEPLGRVGTVQRISVWTHGETSGR